jgi:hypothetical protein
MIDIRFNNNFISGKSKFEWKVIKDNEQHFVNYVHINCKSYTTSRFIEGEGQKYHISADTNTMTIVTERDDENNDVITIAYIG